MNENETRYKIYFKDSRGVTQIIYKPYLKKNMAILAYRVDEVEAATDKLVRRVI